jgi:hypothetical protein
MIMLHRFIVLPWLPVAEVARTSRILEISRLADESFSVACIRLHKL